MKRVLALLVMLAMLISTVAFSIPVLSVEDNTLDEHNVGIKIPYYSGVTNYSEIEGTLPRQAAVLKGIPANGVTLSHTNASKSGEPKMFLDGAINSTYAGKGVRSTGHEDEWGEPLLHLSSFDAAQMKTTVPSAENTYFWKNDKEFTETDVGMSADIWMAWDEDYLYLAARVYDPDGHKLASGGENVWNGDALQIRVDPDGPNSVVDGHGYDAFTTPYPWKDTVRTAGKGETYGAKVMNMGIGYVNQGKRNTNVFDMSHRYEPKMETIETETGDGNVTSEQVLTWQQNHAHANKQVDDPNPFGAVYGTIGVYSGEIVGKAGCTTDYEVAIPWTYMNGSYISEDGQEHIIETPANAGDEFGVSLAVLNAATGSVTAWLTWGSGVCGAQMSNGDYMTAGGSNSMVLVKDELGTITSNGYSPAHTHEFKDADCTAPETCTVCGYQKGFSTGHDYTHTVEAVPTSSSEGVIKSECNTCGEEVTTKIPAIPAEVKHVFDDEFDKSKDTVEGTEWGSEGFNYVYTEDPNETPEDATDDVPVLRGPEAGEREGKQKNVIEYVDDRTVIDLRTGDPGTYFATENKYSAFAYSYDLKLTDTVLEEDGNSSYHDGIYHWFGGASPTADGKQYGMSYCAGFFPEPGTPTKGYFRIYEGYVGTDDYGNKVIAQSDFIDLGTTDWHNIVFMFDPETCTAILTCDGEIMVGAWDEGFSLEGETQVAFIRRFDVSCMISSMKLGSYTAFNKASEQPPTPPTPTTYKVTYDDGSEAGEYEVGASVDLKVPEVYEDAGVYYRFFTWDVESGDATVTRSDYSADNGTANGRKYTMAMPEGEVTLKAVYVAIGDANADNQITAHDYSKFKVTVGVGTEDLKLAESCDVDGDGKLTSQDSLRLRQLVAGVETFVPVK